jgi:hypothetical protein
MTLKDQCLRKGHEGMCAVFAEDPGSDEVGAIWMNAGEMDPRVPHNLEPQSPLVWRATEWEWDS